MYLPNLCRNLLKVGNIDECGGKFDFERKQVKTLNGKKIIAIGEKVGKLN